MLVHTYLFAALALARSADAAFFYYPEWRCVEDHTCAATKRAETHSAEDSLSMRLVQRQPKSSKTPHDLRIRQMASRLTKKYDRKQSRTPTVEATSSREVKRDGSLLSALDKLVRRVVPAGLLPSHGLIMHEIPKVSISTRENKYPISEASVPTQENSAGIDQDGTDYSYFAEVYLGTKTAPYHMLLDTGAGQTWIMGSTCTSGPCKLHNTFGPADSTSFKELSDSFDISYGTGEVAGQLVSDSVTIAGLKIPMTFGVANVTSDDFNNFPIDGILGLSQMTSGHPSFVQSLVDSKQLASNIFGVSLNRASDGQNNGEINFGKPNKAKYSGDLKYTSVSSNAEKDWAIPFDGVGLGTKKSGVSSGLAYIDTGTSFIFSPPADAKKFHENIPGAVSGDQITWTVPCTTTDSVFFTFSGTNFPISSKDWVGPNVNGVCTSNIYGIEVVTGAWLLGDTFLKNVYAVFDIDQSRVGLAPNAVVPVAISSTATSAAATSGGPTSTSASTSASTSTTLPSSTTGGSSASTSGPTSSLLVTESNGSSTGSSTATPTTLAAAASNTASNKTSPTVAPGLNGHQTSVPAAGTQSSAIPASTSEPPKSSGMRLDANLIGAFLITLTFMTLNT